MIKSDFNRCFIFGPKMRIFGRFGPLWPFWPIYWPEIQKNMFHTFHICPGKPPQGGIQNLRFLGGRIIFTIENTSVKSIIALRICLSFTFHIKHWLINLDNPKYFWQPNKDIQKLSSFWTHMNPKS